MFAIVDIETTGSYASANGITEIAIVIHDGVQVVDYFETLVNPVVTIPRYIQHLTGITPAMVSQAPYFSEVAPKIFGLLSDKIFVAHNVNFDYSFVKYHLEQCGYHLSTQKLCTVRAARKFIPGHPSYSLGNICRCLDIEIEARHRAGGDAKATARLLECILKNDTGGEIAAMTKGKTKEQHLPPNLPVAHVAQLPADPGVYYFHNQKGKVIYVGKAKNLKKRVSSHFSNNKPGPQKQEFLREIYSITYKICGSELMAFILECIEIKRLWPIHNRSLKGFEQAFGLYIYEDARGYKRLIIEKQKKHLQPVYTFNLLVEGHQLLRSLADNFGLCARLCFLDTSPGPTLADAESLSPEDYNQRVNQAVAYLNGSLPSFAVVEDVEMMKEQQKGIVLIEKGRFFGMGYLPPNTVFSSIDQLKPMLTQYPENGYIRGLIFQYANKFPELKRAFVA